MDWAKHRKHKAAAKVHVALDLNSFIPIRVVTDSANHHDGRYMSELCGNMNPGDIAVMDRAYVDYVQLNTLTEKGVFWVTRSKSNMKVKVIRSRVNKLHFCETLGHMWELVVAADFCAGFRRSAVVVCGYDGGDDTSACP